jgi:uncharacterized damage-inducible protein DinB
MLDDLLEKWASVRSGLLTTIDKFSDTELAYRPSAYTYSVGETMLHVAHEEDIELRYGLMRQLPELPPSYDAALYDTRSAIKAVLQQSHDQTLAYLRRLGDDELQVEIEVAWGSAMRPFDLVWHVIEHEIHHRGELSLVLGLLGREGLDA